MDPVERDYADGYPGIPQRAGQIGPDRGIAQEMILRRREARTLDAFDSLVAYLRDPREERKAVITISNGWRFYRPTTTFADRFACGADGPASRDRSADRPFDDRTDR